MVNTEHIVIGLWCSILPKTVCGCVFNGLLVDGTFLSISIVCIRVCKWVTLYGLCWVIDRLAHTLYIQSCLEYLYQCIVIGRFIYGLPWL